MHTTPINSRRYQSTVVEIKSSPPHSSSNLNQPTAATILPPFSVLVSVSAPALAPVTSKLTSALTSPLSSEAMILRTGDLIPFVVAAGVSGGGCDSASDLISGLASDGASRGGFDSSRI